MGMIPKKPTTWPPWIATRRATSSGSAKGLFDVSLSPLQRNRDELPFYSSVNHLVGKVQEVLGLDLLDLYFIIGHIFLFNMI